MCKRETLCLIALFVVMAGTTELSAGEPDCLASFVGPFNGGPPRDPTAQEFEVSVAGELTSFVVYGRAFNPGTFIWLLRDASNLVGPNVGALPIIRNGTANFPSGGSYTDPIQVELLVGGVHVLSGEAWFGFGRGGVPSLLLRFLLATLSLCYEFVSRF